ncbi:unnamed protein product [Acanthoscelides obtectus]|uniref:Reverse transcriptase domain-containing protein n=1 Tax=Acanthoscelides obtectus TaxID=200917 RepID=A0A9P0K8L2_ACAOB|nr:unnamed protein product [Acanthoscelides obtectus]CAK1643024.1 hypothetical protein AOBTE_LOCUS13374 [Acanthoscelides obtectus]
MIAYLDKYKIISNKQFGFRQGKSTDDAILDLMTKVSSNINSKDPTLCVFVDLKKAFDTKIEFC